MSLVAEIIGYMRKHSPSIAKAAFLGLLTTAGCEKKHDNIAMLLENRRPMAASPDQNTNNPVSLEEKTASSTPGPPERRY